MSAAEEWTFPVAAGDELQVVVYGEANVSSVLSGRFRIEQDGSIYYPLLGKISVAGMSPTEISELLGQSLSDQVRVSLPTVSVAEYAPVFLIGDVVGRGPYEFQPDMTVFQLVLRAGGVSPAQVSENARLSILKEFDSLTLNHFSLRVRRARLLAEIEGDDFEADGFMKEAAELGTASVVSTEAAIFDARRRARLSRRRTYEAQARGYDQEISSIESSIDLHDQEIRLLEEQLEVQKDLSDRGLAAQSSRREAHRQLMASRREALEFRTALFRARQSRLAVDQALNEAELRIEEENVGALREVELALKENAIALKVAETKARQFKSPRNTAQDALGSAPQYRITRLVDGEYTSRLVDAFEKLERGDVVSVVFLEDRASQPAEESVPQHQARR